MPAKVLPAIVAPALAGAASVASAGVAAAMQKRQQTPFNPITPATAAPAPITGGGATPISPLQKQVQGGDRYQAVTDLLGGQ